MANRSAKQLDALRVGRSELENHHLDELAAGRLSRREFVRRGAVIGMSSTLVAAALAACGGANSASSSSSSAAGPAKKGGTLRLASQSPSAEINPITIADLGGSTMLTQTGDFLTYDNSATRQLQPMLATSWSHNGDGTVWTFKLRRGVTFHNGQPMTADDVVYTFKQQSDPKSGSVALSTFTDVLKPEGVVKVDPHTVAFHLESPNGNFPYIISSDNYNLIIVPKGTDFGTWQKTFMGTGPYKLHSYTQNQGASFVANPHYWAGPPHLDGTTFQFYASQQPQIVALEGGQVDVVSQFTAQGAQALLNNSKYQIIKLPSASHRELSMRNDMAPFTDPRVRQAIALTLDRPAMVQALLQGAGQVGNDSPFAPKFASTDRSVPQRTQDIAKAKALLAAAGHPNGFSTTLTTGQQEEIPQLAQVIAQSATKIGVKIALKVETLTAYYGKSTYGNSDWLDAVMSLVEYGDRGVPNVFLESALSSTGPWNAARFHNRTFDGLVKQYVAAVDLQTQRTLAGKIERLLLAQTPLVIPYFTDILAATTPSVHGIEINGFAIFLGERVDDVTALTITRDVPAPMRDGVILRANVYRPAAPGPWPTLLARTPYGKDLPGASAWLDPVRAAAAGFMVVIQDTRGRFASDGSWQPFRHEADDGYDTVEWAARLPGSNGRVGMFGLSYWGNDQWLAAIAQPPSLAAIAPGLTWCDPADGALRRGGALELGLQLTWALEQGIDDARRRGDAVDGLIDELDRLPEDGFWELPAGAPVIRHAVTDLGGIRADPATGDAARVAGRHDRVRVPVLGIGGWYDCFAQGVLDNHAAMAGRSRVIVGPWTHANFTEAVGGLTFGLRARRDDVTTTELRWFRAQLTPDAPDIDAPPVQIFVMGANRWRDEAAWPPPDATEQRWHLRAGGGLTRAAPGADDPPATTFVYDPADPVPTAGGQTLISPHAASGPVDQAAIEARADVLVFSSEPLADDLEVTGRVRVVLHAESSAPSTDWVARLCDVHPDGRSFNVCDGILRVAAGAPTPRRHELDLWSTSNVFARGHRLRVHVTSSSFPRWERNLNTGDQRRAAHVPAQQRIHHDAERPSWVALPVLERPDDAAR